MTCECAEKNVLGGGGVDCGCLGCAQGRANSGRPVETATIAALGTGCAPRSGVPLGGRQVQSWGSPAVKTQPLVQLAARAGGRHGPSMPCGTCALASSGHPGSSSAVALDPTPRPIPDAVRARDVGLMELEAPSRRSPSVELPTVHQRPMGEDEVDPGGGPYELPPDVVRPWWPRGDPFTIPQLGEPKYDWVQGESIDTCDQERLAVNIEDVASLRDRCLLNLGAHYWVAGADLVVNLRSGHEPTTSKNEMFSDFVPEYMDRKDVSWGILADNLVANDQDETPGCFWNEVSGFMVRAVLHALAMIGCGPKMSGLGSINEDLYDDLRATIRAGNLALALDNGGFDYESAILVDSDGSVAIASTGNPSRVAIAFWTASLSKFLRRDAALADYYLWWAWRLHSLAKSSGGENYRVAGMTCARLAFACIGRIASTIVHEWVHTQGYWPGHCRGPSPDAGLAFLSAGAGMVASAAWETVNWWAFFLTTALTRDEGYHCRHNVLEFAAMALFSGTYDLPTTPTMYRDGLASQSDWDALADMLPSWPGSPEWDGLWSRVYFINDSSDRLLNGSDTLGFAGSYSLYEGIWGFSAILEEDSCASGTFQITTIFAETSMTAQFTWTIPDACRDGAGNNHAVSY